MNHKRKRAKNQRSGCLWCKPHKANGMGAEKRTARDRRWLAKPLDSDA